MTCAAARGHVVEVILSFSAPDERRRLEDRHPELAGDRRPILAHEGRYEPAPLRAGDVVPGAGPAGHSGGHSHGHSPGPDPSHPPTA